MRRRVFRMGVLDRGRLLVLGIGFQKAHAFGSNLSQSTCQGRHENRSLGIVVVVVMGGWIRRMVMIRRTTKSFVRSTSGG